MSENAEYIPSPVDTSDVNLPEELLSLSELLSENVHENWAAARMSDGWTFGPEFDEAARKTPNMVPYPELDECEKDYDRRSSMETLKLIMKLGFKIERL